MPSRVLMSGASMKRILTTTLLFLPLLITFTVHSQTQQPAPIPAADDKSKEGAEQGIPVKNQLVIDRCSSCHKKDEKSNLTRISFERKTPEGWQETLKRMVRL